MAQKTNIHVHCALTHATAGKHIDKAGIVKLRKTGRDMSASKMSPKPFDTSFAKPPTPTLKEFAAVTATPVFKGPVGICGHAEDRNGHHVIRAQRGPARRKHLREERQSAALCSAPPQRSSDHHFTSSDRSVERKE